MRPSAKLLAVTQPAIVSGLCGAEGCVETDSCWMPATPGLNEPLDLIEYAGRVDYGAKSLSKMGDRDIIRRWLDSGHESMIEMVDAVFLIECSRVVTHELVRHRIASYQQESQRYVSYKDEEPEHLFILPPEIEGNEDAESAYWRAIHTAHRAYLDMVEAGVPKQIARYVLPNATRTRIIVKMNLREWRHVLRLRTHTSAQPEMREVMAQVHKALQKEFGHDLFPDDIAAERGVR